MGKLFGTDGIRGIANETLTCDLAYRVGQATALCLSRVKGKAPTVVIGKDTRLSSDMLEGALLSGLCACGSTDLKKLQELVRQGYYDLGIAFDGDGDRCLIVDENGEVVDGDQILAICAGALRQEGRLPGNGFVATVMSNLGLRKYCQESGMELKTCPVGDRNVLEAMVENGMVLGGEQSGHVIFLDHMPTGDGQLTALKFLQIVCRTRKPVSRLAAAVTRYPQVLRNVPGPATLPEREALSASPVLRDAVAKAEASLAGEGRVLLRASGTEAMLRVMVEAPTEAAAENLAATLADTVENLQK